MTTFIGITVPFVGLLTGFALLWGWGFGWIELALLAAMYALTAVGITVGFHRHFTHGSFETNGVVRFVLAVLGSMAVQGNLLKWVAIHRRHHQHSDEADDPHTPHQSGRGLIGSVCGAWHAHIGWAFVPDHPHLYRYVKDLQRSPSIRLASALFPLWVVLGLVLPAVVGWLAIGGWAGAVLGLVWGGLIRVFLVHHVTWSINSACHLWGTRPFASGDESRNNFVFGVLALGEGWHNNHHAFPTSARHGLRWWEPDLSYWIIRAMAWCGLAWQVRKPTAQQLVGLRYQGNRKEARESESKPNRASVKSLAAPARSA